MRWSASASSPATAASRCSSPRRRAAAASRWSPSRTRRDRPGARATWSSAHHLGARRASSAGIIDALNAARRHARRSWSGGIAKPRLFRELRPDARALAILARCGPLRDDVAAARARRRARVRGHRGRRVDALPAGDRAGRRVLLGPRAPTPEEWARHPLRVPRRQGDRAVRHRPERRRARRRRRGRRGHRGHRRDDPARRAARRTATSWSSRCASRRRTCASTCRRSGPDTIRTIARGARAGRSRSRRAARSSSTARR